MKQNQKNIQLNLPSLAYNIIGIYNILKDQWEERKIEKVLQMKQSGQGLWRETGQLWKETCVQPRHQSKKASTSSFYLLSNLSCSKKDMQPLKATLGFTIF